MKKVMLLWMVLASAAMFIGSASAPTAFERRFFDVETNLVAPSKHYPPVPKPCLSIVPTDLSLDNLLHQPILTLGARFNSETGSRLERTVDYVQEFEADLLHVPLFCPGRDTTTLSTTHYPLLVAPSGHKP